MDDELKRISLVIFGIVALLALVGFILLFSEATKTGNAVAKVVSSSKSTTTTKSIPLTDKKSTTLTQKSSLTEKRAPSPFTPPVSSLPQPAPGDQNSDVQGVGCTTCAKQYEYRTVQGICRGTSEDPSMYEEPGIDISCSRTDGYNDHRHSDGNYVFDMNAIARCTSGKIISYGAECPYTSTMTKIGPTHGTIVFDAGFWTELPLVDEVKTSCQRVSALPSEVDDAELRIYVTCMREKT